MTEIFKATISAEQGKRLAKQMRAKGADECPECEATDYALQAVTAECNRLQAENQRLQDALVDYFRQGRGVCHVKQSTYELALECHDKNPKP